VMRCVGLGTQGTEGKCMQIIDEEA
jgi:hypothetical protein